MLIEANEIMSAKDNALASLVIEKLFKKRPTTQKISMTKLTEHFKTQFCQNEKLPNIMGFTKLVTANEIATAKRKLK